MLKRVPLYQQNMHAFMLLVTADPRMVLCLDPDLSIRASRASALLHALHLAVVSKFRALKSSSSTACFPRGMFLRATVPLQK